MANAEKNGYMKYKDGSGNVTTMYPKTKIANVDGLQSELNGKAASNHTHPSDDTKLDLSGGTMSGPLRLNNGLRIGLPNEATNHNYILIGYNSVSAEIDGESIVAVPFGAFANNGIGGGLAIETATIGSTPAVYIKARKFGLEAPTYLFGNRIMNIGTPTDDNDAANKSYVDSAIQTAIQNTWEASY